MASEHEETTSYCPDCQRERPLTAFYRSKDGQPLTRCKEHHLAYERQRRAQRREAHPPKEPPQPEGFLATQEALEHLQSRALLSKLVRTGRIQTKVRKTRGKRTYYWYWGEDVRTEAERVALEREVVRVRQTTHERQRKDPPS